MGSIISLINTTPDGFVDSQYVNADAAFHEFVHGLLTGTEVVAFGRNSFELFQQIWPAVLEKPDAPEPQVRMAHALTNIRKFVFSGSLTSTSWKNSEILKKIDDGRIDQLRANGDKGLLTIGSPGLVAALTEERLVDEYYFCVQPMIAGSGHVRLFDKMNLGTKQSLRFVGSVPLNSGVLILHYRTSR